MTAKGKINTTNVQINDRIIVDTNRKVIVDFDECFPSHTKTGEGVVVTRVINKEKAAGRRGYVVTTGVGRFYAEPIQTMFLAPEDAAGVKRAQVEAIEIHKTVRIEEDRDAIDAAWDAEVEREELAEVAELVTEDEDRAEALAIEAAENEGMPCPAERDEEAAKPVSAPPAAGAAGSSVVAILERVWALIREENPELPEVVIVTGSAFVGPPRWAHHRASGWSARAEKGAALTKTGDRLAEMFVAGETLAKGAVFTLETMLHEGGHALGGVRCVKDTSRQGRWHNAKFRELCQELGLEWPEGKKADPQIGFSDMLITEATKERYAKLLDELEAAIHLTINVPAFLAPVGGEDGEGSRGGERIPGGRHGGKAQGSGGANPSSNNIKATCGCPEPRIIRASRKVLAEDPIICGRCREEFTEAV